MEKIIEAIIISSSQLMFTEIDIGMKVESLYHLIKEYLNISELAIAYKYNPKNFSSEFEKLCTACFTNSIVLKKYIPDDINSFDDIKIDNLYKIPITQNLEEIGVIYSSSLIKFPILIDYIALIIRADMLISKGISKNVIFESILNSFSDGVIILGNNDEVLLMNDKVKEFIEQNSSPYNDVGKSIFLNSLKNDGDIINFSEIVLKKNEVQLTNFYGELEGKIYFLSDITEFTNDLIENKHREKLALIGEMSAKLAHEIRNPLTAVRGFMELLLNDKKIGKNDENNEIIRVVMEEVDYINGIIGKLLDFSKKHEIDLNEVNNINIILSDILFLFKEEMDKNNIRISKLWSNEKPMIAVDKKSLKHIFGNLINNAIGSMGSGGQLSIKTEILNNSVEIVISDTGCGISKKNIDNIFNPFFTTKERGTGLGLSIVKKTVEIIGGSIYIDSVENKGTDVKVTIPVINFENEDTSDE